AYTQSSTSDTEAFDLPHAVDTDPFSVSDARGDGDGFPEPGENVNLNISVTNNTGSAVTNVTVAVNGGTPVNVGTVNQGQVISTAVPYVIPGDAACGGLHSVSIVVASSI